MRTSLIRGNHLRHQGANVVALENVVVKVVALIVVIIVADASYFVTFCCCSYYCMFLNRFV